MSEESNYNILGGSAKLIESLRFSDYKNATYAISELVDNSVDAQAQHVEILCKDIKVHSSNRLNLEEIAVLDDGIGMDADTLRKSLKFGDGKESKINDLGKFGVGLPNASISQCKHIDVYTWTKSIDDAIHTYINVDEMKKKMTLVPKPTIKDVPAIWKNASKYLSKTSGTLIIWSQIDRCEYKTSKAFIKNSKNLIARIYRKFIHKSISDKKTKLIIRTASFTASNDHIAIIEEDNAIKPNDPLYLMAPSSTPEPWNNEAMFEEYGDNWEDSVSIYSENNERHEVMIRCSIVKENARPHDQSGATRAGKHANDNLGVSLVRAGRELDIDIHLTKQQEYRDRWWGVEVEFPPSLDNFFGVSNTKQQASKFSNTTKNLSTILYNDKKDEHQTKKELKNDGEDEKVTMLDLVRKVDHQIRFMRDAIQLAKEGTRSSGSDDKPEERAVKKRIIKNPTNTDKIVKTTPKDKRIQESISSLEKEGYTIIKAEEIAKKSIEAGEKFVWLPAKLSGTQFFDVLPSASGQLYIKINTNHAAYKNLMHIVDELPKDLAPEDAASRLKHVWDGLRLLIASWARYEDETRDDHERIKIQNFRISWGIILDDFMKENK